MYKLFLVEDDEAIAGEIRRYLETWDFQVRCVRDYKHVTWKNLRNFSRNWYCWRLCCLSSTDYHWCQEIRKLSKVPVIFLSSASDNLNIVMAMNMGGDDFIEKPFDLNVLTAKIQAVLRRTYEFRGTAEILECQGAYLNLSDASFQYKEEKIELTKNEFKILKILMEHTDKIVDRDTIIAALWESDEFIDDNTLTVNVARLRRKLETVGLKEMILTKKGIGYMVRS